MAFGLSRTARRRHRYEVMFRATPEGRAEMADLVRRYHVLGPVTVEGDPVTSAYRDGQRSVVIEIIRTLALTDADLIRLANEQDDEQ